MPSKTDDTPRVLLQMPSRQDILLATSLESHLNCFERGGANKVISLQIVHFPTWLTNN